MHVALIGARGFGRHHLAGLQASPYVDRVSLAGRDRSALGELAAAFPKVSSLTTDYRELLTDPEIDLVDLVVPHDLHLSMALEAFQAGKHVLVEKPPARTPAEFTAMREAATAVGKRLFVVMNLLFNPLHRVVRQLIDRGAIGEPFLSLEIRFGRGLAVYQDPANWRADRERCGGGLLIDGGFHAVYRQLYFLESLGAPVRVVADCGQIGVREPHKGEDFATLTFGYASGAQVHLMNQWTSRADLGRFPSGILGTEGTLAFTGDPSQPLLLRRPGKEDYAVPIPAGPQGFPETVTACVEHYVRCLAENTTPYVDLDLAALTLQIIHTTYSFENTGGAAALSGSFETRFPEIPNERESIDD
jgi:predicted dehydrogenase